MSPQVRQAARRLWVLYSALTLLLVVLLMFAGMGLYEAVCHAFTTLAAGGFSPNPSSVAGYNNPAVEWILVPFMILSGASFTLQYKAYTSDPRAFFRDGEFVLYFVVCAIGALGAAAYTYAGDVELSLRQGWFQSASLISSTGFASTDYNLWNDSARALMVLMMLVGGCAGSAAGGPKAIRYLLTFKHIGREITRTIHPHAILPVKYKGVVIRRSVLRAVSILVFLYLISYFAVGLFLVLLGNDLVTGFSASLACLGNVGPGFGPAGPMGNFAGFSPLAKFVLTIGMLLGRLEIVTVLALLHRDFWGNLRWRADK